MRYEVNAVMTSHSNAQKNHADSSASNSSKNGSGDKVRSVVAFATLVAHVGSCSEASYLMRNSAMDDSIGGS